ncbi:MAG: gliding motility-associated C-terminal domain-containing protein [Crocinitomicaceae bacterium]|nr:gliding motility-associated C-terminal domain-containing protein [Crocinitomicaceae bacterium]
MKNLIFIGFLFLCCNLFAQDETSFRTETGISFIENKGQFDGRSWNSSEHIEFAYAQNPFYIFFSKQGLTYRFDKIIRNPERKNNPQASKRTSISTLITGTWLNANEDVTIIAEEILPNYYSYAIKNFATGDVSNANNIAGHKKITYKNLYDNIDIEYTIHPEGGIKYNVILHPGANPSDVQLLYSTISSDPNSTSIDLGIDELGDLITNTSLGQIVEHKPVSFYANTEIGIKSNYVFENNVLSFELENYDNTQKVVIDPWVISPTFTTSTAVWEVETDVAGNIYSIGGETPMELKKFNSAGVLQWTYTTPWDTSNVWLGTLATDANGVSYITSGTVPEIERIDVNGNMVWHNTGPGGIFGTDEFWSITFNCDNTKLIVGGTGGAIFNFKSMIYEIDITNGNTINQVEVGVGAQGGFTPVEVRSISSSKNAKYIFLTHQQVGAINENIGSCPSDAPIFEVPNQEVLGYKCENYLPATQNGGGLKALIANDNYFYTHGGDQLRQWDLTNGNLINTVTIPGGAANTIPFLGGTEVECSGLDVDDCGNVYAGAMDRIVKFDANLNVITEAMVGFNVYDVSVNSNGEVIANGAQFDNGAAGNRQGRIQAVNLSACAQYSLVCCDANICSVAIVCESDPVFALVTTTPGGTWSGTGVDASGNFNPTLAGVGTHTVTYTLACGSETISITVDPCATIDICEETNGDLTASGGNGSYTWSTGVPTPMSSPINSEQECIDCAAATPEYFLGFYTGCDISTCNYIDTVWTQYATGTTTLPPSSYPIQIVDGNGVTTVINSAAGLIACSANPCAGITLTMNIDSQSDPSCFGGSNGAATVSTTGGTSSYNYLWTPGSLPGTTQNSLSAGTYTVAILDANGCSGSGTVIIGEPTELIASAVSTPAACGSNDGTATGSATGGTGSYSYSWSPSGGNSQTATALAPNTYIVTVTDQNGCTDDANIAVTTLNGPTISLDNSTDVSCFNGNDGTATVSATGGGGSYTYSWSPGALTGATQNTLGANTYTVTVTDAGGCTDAISFDILEPTELTIDTVSTSAANCGASDGSGEVLAVGGTGTYSYSWSPVGGTASTATGIPAGAYTVTVTDQNGCTNNVAFTIPTLGGPTISVTSTTDASCFGNADGEVTIVANGGSSPYTYSWSPSGGNGATATGLSAGIYTVTVTDNSGCVSFENVTINEPSEITLTETITDENCGQLDGSVAINANGGSGNYSYLWLPNSEVTSSINGLVSGTYGVTVTDDSGCSVNASYFVDVIGSLNVIATPQSATISEGGSVPIFVTGADNYVWTPSEGLDCADCSNPIASPTITTMYIVTGTDASGCTGSDTVYITFNITCADIFVPTIFSPNAIGPAANEQLCVYGNCISELRYSVYNRWGELVFETTSIGDCWNGEFKGQPAITGVYAYKLYAKLFDGEVIEESGNVTLVR